MSPTGSRQPDWGDATPGNRGGRPRGMVQKPAGFWCGKWSERGVQSDFFAITHTNSNRCESSYVVRFRPVPDASATSFFVRSMSGHLVHTNLSSFEKRRTRKNTRNSSRMLRSGTALTQTYSRRIGRKCTMNSGESSNSSSDRHTLTTRNPGHSLASARTQPLQLIWTKLTDCRQSPRPANVVTGRWTTPRILPAVVVSFGCRSPPSNRRFFYSFYSMIERVPF